MRERRLRSQTALTLLLAALCLALLGPGRLGAQPLDDQPWHEVESEHFTLLTGADAEQSLELLRQLEALRAVLAEATHLEVTSPVPTRIYLFPNDRAFHPYKHLYHGAPAAMSGAFYPRDDVDILTLHGGLRTEARLTALHEYVHVVLRNNLPGLPLWLEEGLAELFATLEPAEDGLRLGRAVPWHVRALGKWADLPLTELLAVGPQSDRYQRFENQGLFYARAWELTHYLLTGHAERRRQALRYIAFVRRGVEPSAAFVRAFGDSPETLEEELKAHRERGFEARLLPSTVARGPSERPRIRRLSHAALLVRLGDLLLAQGDRRVEARFHFEQAVERITNPSAGVGRLRVGPGGEVGGEVGSRGVVTPEDREAAGDALRGLGLLAERSGDLALARSFYRRALEVHGTAALSHYRFAASLLWLGRATSAEKVAEARQHLEAAIALDPHFAPAWDALVRLERFAEKSAGGPEPETGALARALGAGPEERRAGAILGLAMLRSRDGRAGDVRLLAGRVEGAELQQRLAAVLAHLDWLAPSGPVPDHDLLRIDEELQPKASKRRPRVQ